MNEAGVGGLGRKAPQIGRISIASLVPYLSSRTMERSFEAGVWGLGEDGAAVSIREARPRLAHHAAAANRSDAFERSKICI